MTQRQRREQETFQQRFLYVFTFNNFHNFLMLYKVFCFVSCSDTNILPLCSLFVSLRRTTVFRKVKSACRLWMFRNCATKDSQKRVLPSFMPSIKSMGGHAPQLYCCGGKYYLLVRRSYHKRLNERNSLYFNLFLLFFSILRYLLRRNSAAAYMLKDYCSV